MNRDHVLGTALRELPVPDPAPDFFDQLTARLEAEMGTAAGAVSVPSPRRIPAWFPAAAAAVVAMAAGVGVGLAVQGSDAPPAATDTTELTLDDLTAAVIEAEEVPDLAPVSHFEVGSTPGAKVFGAQFLSPVNVQRIEDQIGAVGGARSEYIRPTGGGGLSSLGVLFPTEADASHALGFILGVLPEQQDAASGTTPLGHDQVEGPLIPIAVDGLGDEAYGFEGFMDSRYPGTTQTLYVWRQGSAVLAIWGTGFEEGEVRDLAATMAARLD